MQIHLFGPHGARALSAILRNCLSYEGVQEYCPVRKCRRDGFCSGPLASVRGAHVQLATGCDDACGDSPPVPVCWLTLTEKESANVGMALRANVRALGQNPAATVIETTRTIFGRRWKRLFPSAEGGVDAGQS